jgi:hypothetical protein
MLPTGFRKQPADVVFDERDISNIHIAGEGGANSPVAVRRFVGKNLCRWLKVERFRKNRLVACVRRLDVGDNLRCVGETIGELRLDGQFHSQTPGTVVRDLSCKTCAVGSELRWGSRTSTRGTKRNRMHWEAWSRDKPVSRPSNSIKAQGDAHER